MNKLPDRIIYELRCMTLCDDSDQMHVDGEKTYREKVEDEMEEEEQRRFRAEAIEENQKMDLFEKNRRQQLLDVVISETIKNPCVHFTEMVYIYPIMCQLYELGMTDDQIHNFVYNIDTLE